MQKAMARSRDLLLLFLTIGSGFSSYMPSRRLQQLDTPLVGKLNHIIKLCMYVHMYRRDKEIGKYWMKSAKIARRLARDIIISV